MTYAYGLSVMNRKLSILHTLIALVFAFSAQGSNEGDDEYSIRGSYIDASKFVYEKAKEKWIFAEAHATNWSVKIKENKKKETNAVLIYEWDAMLGRKIIVFTATFTQEEDKTIVRTKSKSSKLYGSASMTNDLELWLSEFKEENS